MEYYVSISFKGKFYKQTSVDSIKVTYPKKTKTGGSMFRKSIRLPLIYFVVAIIWQLIFYQKVRWVDNIGISILMVLIILFYHWTKKPYKWNRDRSE